MSDPDPDIFSFLDYRAYLAAYYAARKARGGFSYRAFSKRASLGSPNYLKLVIDGDRNLSREMAGRFARACRLDDAQARFFEALVAFNQASTIEDRNACYARLRRQRRFREAHALQAPQDLYHSCWYLPAIRELAMAEDFRPDPEWIARRLSPPIRVSEARTALSTLLELGMLERLEDGRLVQREATVSTGPEVLSLHLSNYHRAMMEHAKGSIERHDAGQRDISSLTLCLGPAGIGEVKRAIQRFRRELLELAELEPTPRQVVQINFQLFPLSTLEQDVDETGTG